MSQNWTVSGSSEIPVAVGFESRGYPSIAGSHEDLLFSRHCTCMLPTFPHASALVSKTRSYLNAGLTYGFFFALIVSAESVRETSVGRSAMFTPTASCFV